MDDLDKITETINSISDSSQKQENAISRIHEQVAFINNSITSTLSMNEEAAAASVEMKEDAKLLEDEMGKFNLRQRTLGRAYIPPEKRNDPTFIREANENYKKSLQTGIPNFTVTENKK